MPKRSKAKSRRSEPDESQTALSIVEKAIGGKHIEKPITKRRKGRGKAAKT